MPFDMTIQEACQERCVHEKDIEIGAWMQKISREVRG